MSGEVAEASTSEALGLWLLMLSLTNMVERRLRRNLRAGYNATLHRRDVMAASHERPEGTSMGEIVRRLLVTGGNFTAMVERLEREGLIRRQQRPEDLRGREIFEEMARDFEGWVASMLSGLDEEVEQPAELPGKAGRSVRNINGEEKG